ncbi:hypothetical protein BKA70DRAFT_1563301 [Coprinopsis sp. MPI-PUGE-AT-0042]|nr:hypothetical protein BKA70DRAFT_1563301 [Coprinopsis sp. MPI-PUGE-AT-0042]
MSSNHPAPRPKIPQSFLEKVAAGNVTALFSFRDKLKNAHYSLNVLDAIISALQSDPRSPSIKKSELAFRGLQSLECLEKILIASLAYPHLLEATRSRMRACMDDLLAWIESSIQSCYLTVPDDPSTLEYHLALIANSIVACLELKGAFMDEFVQHPVLVRTLLTLWSSAHIKDSSNVIPGVYLTGTSPILAAFKAAISHKAGFQAITELLIHQPRQLELFCKANRARFMQIPYYVNNTLIPFNLNTAKSRLFFDAWEVTAILLYNAAVRGALFKAGYLGYFTATAVKLASVLSPGPLLQLAAYIFEQCVQEGSNPNRNLQSILDHGYITLLSDGLRCDLGIPSNKSNALCVLSSLEAYTYYPQPVISLWNALNRESLERMLEINTLPSIGRRWSHFVVVAKESIAELRAIDTPVTFCDNNQHHDYSPKTNTVTRSCSGCRLVVYCSQECQREDWKNRHRKECDSMRLTYLEFDDRESSSRSMQVRNSFEPEDASLPPQMPRDSRQESFGVVNTHLASLRGERAVVIINFCHSTLEGGRRFDTVPVKDYLAYGRPPSDCTQIDNRLETMIKDFS